MIIVLTLSIIGVITTLFLNLSLSSMYVYKYETILERKNQAYYLSKSALKFVVNYFKQKDSKTDNLQQLWAYEYPLQIDENTSILITIKDENRKLSIYFLKKEKLKQALYRLFQILNISQDKLYNLENKLKNNKDFLENINQLKYLSFTNQDLYGKQIDNKIYKGLIKTLTIYDIKVNINTAGKEVLMSLSPDITESIALNIIDKRKQKPFNSIYDLLNVEGINSDLLYKISPFIDVKSSIFDINIEININDFKYIGKAKIKKDGKNINILYWNFK